MRSAEVLMHGIPAGILEEIETGKKYRFIYFEEYKGPSIALTMPVEGKEFVFNRFPPFFDGLLPEGLLLEGLLRLRKIDKLEYLKQLIAVGNDLVGLLPCGRKWNEPMSDYLRRMRRW